MLSVAREGDEYGLISAVNQMVLAFAYPKSRRIACQTSSSGKDNVNKPNGRGERIRTSDSCVPNAVLYQAELHPENHMVGSRVTQTIWPKHVGSNCTQEGRAEQSEIFIKRSGKRSVAKIR